MKYRFERDGQSIDIDVVPSADGLLLHGPDGQPQLIRVKTRADGGQTVVTPWGELDLTSARRGSEIFAHVGARRLTARVERARPTGAAGSGANAVGLVRAPMAGKLLRLDVGIGDRLKAGQPLAVIEAMKMENELVAPIDGVVVEVGPAAPSTIEKGALVARLEPR